MRQKKVINKDRQGQRRFCADWCVCINRYNPRMLFSTFFRVPPQHETLRTIVLMRVIALAGQLLAVALARFWLQIDLPLFPLFTAMLFLAAFNGWTWRRMQRARPAGDAELFMQLLVDVMTLSALLYFSGGATNPFVSFYLPAIAVAAAILPWRHAAVLSLFSVVCYSIMTSVYIPLHIPDPDRAVAYHLAGMWANFAVSAALITWFVAHMSRAVRERDRQLALAREQHLQSERMIALGTQAASAAHEMGTPLATVAVIAGELRHEAKRDAALAAYSDDLATIDTQIALCKTALEHMSMQARLDTASASADKVFMRRWLAQFIDDWRLRHPATRLDLSLPSSDASIGNVRAVGQILLTLLDNAGRAAAEADTLVVVSLKIEARAVVVQVKDAGPGIDAGLLKKLGYEPVQSTSGGQGIGLMLAFATARQIAATIELAARQPNGTIATLTIPLA